MNCEDPDSDFTLAGYLFEAPARSERKIYR
jgi:hypothetical protein